MGSLGLIKTCVFCKLLLFFYKISLGEGMLYSFVRKRKSCWKDAGCSLLFGIILLFCKLWNFSWDLIDGHLSLMLYATWIYLELYQIWNICNARLQFVWMSWVTCSSMTQKCWHCLNFFNNQKFSSIHAHNDTLHANSNCISLRSKQQKAVIPKTHPFDTHWPQKS